MSYHLFVTLLLAGGGLCISCQSTNQNDPQGLDLYEGELVETLLMGASDNPEVIKFLPGEDEAIVVSSKARTITRLGVSRQGLTELSSATLFDDDGSESELTHLSVSHDGTWGALSRTLVDIDGDEQVTNCRGELVFVDLSSQNFGTILKRLDVGPMPDAVAINETGSLVATANERDVVWGKCDGVEGLELGSVSLVDVSGGIAEAFESTRVVMDDAVSGREPESLAFSSDGQRLVVTLQDSHEVALIDVSAALNASEDTAVATYVSLPVNQFDAEAWPDGVVKIQLPEGPEVFAIAGEANNTITILNQGGTILAQLELLSSDLPSAMPRGDWGQGEVFQIDSLASFAFNGETYLSATLKSSGAVGVWRVSNLQNPQLAAVIPVGQNEGGTFDSESTVLPEGIAASSTGLIITANEGESSISLIRPVVD